MENFNLDIENRKESLHQVRDHIINVALISFAITAFGALFFSLVSGYESGWNQGHAVHVIVYINIVLAVVFRRRIPTNIKSSLVILMFVLLSIAGFLTRSNISMWMSFMYTGLVLALILFRLVYAIALFILIMTVVTVTGILFLLGLYSFPVDFDTYHGAVSTWVSMIFAVLMIAVIIINSMKVLHDHLFGMADTLDDHRRELQASNEKLQGMNEEYEMQSETLLNTQVDLMEKEQLYRAIFKSANDCIILINIEGIIYQSNKKTDELFGENVDGKHPWDFSPEIQPDDRKSEEKGWEFLNAVFEGIPQRFFWTHQRRDGTFIETEVSLSPMKVGDTDFVLGIVRDISDQKKLEKQLVQTQKMEAVGTLTSGLAHDFNNILGAIMGGVTLVERIVKDCAYREDDRALKYIDIVMKASNRASGIISQLMNLSRNREETLLPVDLNQSLESVIKIIQNSLPKSISIEYRKFNEPAIVKAEQTQVEQVLLNLCINASHAMTIMRSPEEKEGGLFLLT